MLHLELDLEEEKQDPYKNASPENLVWARWAPAKTVCCKDSAKADVVWWWRRAVSI